MRKPEVSVTLKIARLQRVYVLGEVRLSGAYDLKPGWTVTQAIAAAGGLTPLLQQADVKIIIEAADHSRTRSFTYSEALQPSALQLTTLSSGDTLRVEAIPLLTVYVTGKVKSPGLYQLRKDSRSILSAIAQAGGTTEDASLTVHVLHESGADVVVDLTPALAEGKPAHPQDLEAGDVVIVPDLLNRFAVLGYVGKPGYYPMLDGHSYTLFDAIAIAEGAGASKGRITKIAIVRTLDGKSTRNIYNLDAFLRKGDVTQNPKILAGDLIYIPQSSSIDLATSLPGVAALGALYYYSKH